MPDSHGEPDRRHPQISGTRLSFSRTSRTVSRDAKRDSGTALGQHFLSAVPSLDPDPWLIHGATGRLGQQIYFFRLMKRKKKREKGIQPDPHRGTQTHNRPTSWVKVPHSVTRWRLWEGSARARELAPGGDLQARPRSGLNGRPSV